MKLDVFKKDLCFDAVLTLVVVTHTVLSYRVWLMSVLYVWSPGASRARGPVGHCTSGRPLNPPLMVTRRQAVLCSRCVIYASNLPVVFCWQCLLFAGLWCSCVISDKFCGVDWPTTCSLFPLILTYIKCCRIGWCCWLGLLTCKTASRITYTVLVETLNPA